MKKKKWSIDVKNLPDIDMVDVAFGRYGRADGGLLPPYDEIPEEFKNFNSHTKWNKFFNDRFFYGLKNLKLFPKEGVDSERAWKIIESITSSFAPQHEHKEAGVAYLMSLFFDDATWERGEPTWDK